MLKRIAVPIAMVLLVAGCSKQPSSSDNTTSQPSTAAAPGGTAAAPGTAAPGAAAPRAERPATRAEAPKPVELPAGTVIYVRLDNAVGSKISQTGDRFTASVSEPVEVGGVVAIPKGASASGTVDEAHPRGRFKGAALLRLSLHSVTANGATYPVHATISRSMKGKGKRTGVAIGGGAGLGALIGGIAGGGRGAAIGAAAGAGAGTAGAAFTDNKDIVLPAESSLAFELSQATTLKKE